MDSDLELEDTPDGRRVVVAREMSADGTLSGTC
jgi:hypothetical protein